MRRAVLLLAVLVLPAASRAARQGGTPVALVTAETQNQLLVVGLPDGRVERRFHMPADPQNVEANRNVAVVVSTRAGAVTLLDTLRLRVTRVFRGFGSPHIAALSPNGQFAYVTDDTRGQLVVIGLARKRILTRLFVGFGAHHMSFRPRHHELWIAMGERARSIHIVDTTYAARPRRLGWFSPAGGGLMHDLALAPNGRLWVTYDDRPAISVFDPRTRRLLFTRTAGSPPQHVAFGRHAYVTSGNDGILRVFSEVGRLLRVAVTPKGSFNLGLGGGIVLTPSLTQGTLTELTENGRPLGRRRVANAARDAALVVLP
jgi:DNA-binding beta-propeller fold protein YncE